MTIEEALRAHLIADVGLAALIDSRVYPVQLPQRPLLPSVTYTRISTRPLSHRDAQQPSYSRPRFQLDVWASSYSQCVAVRSALRTAMGTLKQNSNPRIDVALLQDDRDDYEAEPGRWRAILDYFVWHKE